MNATEARERFGAARVARLATAAADGRPHVVPIAFVVEAERIYHAVDAKPKRTAALRRLANVRENPSVSVLADHWEEEDWSSLWWARADGRARILEPENDEAQRAVALLAGRYSAFTPVGQVVVIDVERWSGWTARQG